MMFVDAEKFKGYLCKKNAENQDKNIFIQMKANKEILFLWFEYCPEVNRRRPAVSAEPVGHRAVLADSRTAEGSEPRSQESCPKRRPIYYQHSTSFKWILNGSHASPLGKLTMLCARSHGGLVETASL